MHVLAYSSFIHVLQTSVNKTLIAAFVIVFAENLSRKSSTTVSLSFTFDNRFANFANDGSLKTSYYSCSHTDVNKNIAWFQVDLGEPYSINNVKLYYRKEGKFICNEKSVQKQEPQNEL